jgi:hypothetical protein
MNAPGIVGKGVHEAMRVLCETGLASAGRNELEVYLRMPDHRDLAGPGTQSYDLALRLYDEGCVVHDSISSERSWAETDADAPWAPGGIKLVARIDRIDQLASDHWQIIDWKTGSDRDDVTDAQLDVYHVTARTSRLIPRDARVTAIAWNLKTKRRRVRELTRANAAATLKKFAALAPQLATNIERDATPGPYCSFCRWRDRCPESDPEGRFDWYEPGEEAEDEEQA